jgi:hypothetical protein
MPAVFQQALAQQQPVAPPAMPPGAPDLFAPWVDPNAAQLDALQAKLNAPQQPTFTPEQIAQRKADNAQQYALGLLGQLSGNQALGDVGGQVFKQALANRQPKYTDHGTYDPITGEFNYSPDYLYDRTQTQYNNVANRSASQQTQYLMNQQRIAERLQATRENNERSRANAFVIAGGMGLGAGQPSQIGSSPQGWPVFRDKQGRLLTYDQGGNAVAYQGAVSPKESNQGPTEDQSKAAGWFEQATKGAADMAAGLRLDPTASRPGPLETAIGALPSVGPTLQNAQRSPARQMFMHGASAFSEAVLRAATGAGVNHDEAVQKIQELTPIFGDSDQVIAQKLAQQPMYLATLKARAGRALTQGSGSAGPAPGQPAIGANPAPAAASAPGDPLGLGGLFGGKQ